MKKLSRNENNVSQNVNNYGKIRIKNTCTNQNKV
ncbi:Uncharacterised protein [Bergeyella zoohelcum]|uniref:Uncharacterized protein n=1 Tax=Bergeyella zoohelcum TaxID=1015 RepID=A0A7Z8YP69_9FLAO|nr:Uncharacterised protein [Bergeyella zoohelcum]